MNISEIVAWLNTRYLPLQYSIPWNTRMNLVEDAIRYWNTHSAFPHLEMVDVSSSSTSGSVQASSNLKSVVKVYPAQNPHPGFLWEDHPMWSLLGMTVLDNVTTTLIEMASAFAAMRVYIGSDFNWKCLPSFDPDEGPYVVWEHKPSGVTQLCLLGLYRIREVDNVVSQHILDWIIEYSHALFLIAEGNVLRKASVIGLNNDGNQMIQEGKEKKEKLEQRLVEEGRWVVMGKRIGG